MASCRANIRWPYCPFWSLRLRGEVLEIGTYMGHTTRQMAENLGTAIIHTVDLPQNFSVERDPEQNFPKEDVDLIARRVVGREFNGHPCASRIKQHFADTASWDFHEAGRPTFFSSMAPTLTNIARMTLKNLLSFVAVEACFSGTIAMRLILGWYASSPSGGAKERTLSGSRALPSRIGKAPEL